MSNYKFKTTNIRGKQYVEVNERIKFFRQEDQYKDWTIMSEFTVLDSEQCVCKTTIADATGRVIATGHAHEVQGSSNINKTSYVENCETSAIGRAAAFLAITNDNIASAEEVDQAINVQNKIVQSEKKLTSALVDLGKVSHIGSYNSWLSDNKNIMQDLKDLSPKYYSKFLLDFNKIKTQLETKGIIKNG